MKKMYVILLVLKIISRGWSAKNSTFVFQKPANILVMGEGPERGRVKIGKHFEKI